MAVKPTTKFIYIIFYFDRKNNLFIEDLQFDSGKRVHKCFYRPSKISNSLIFGEM